MFINEHTQFANRMGGETFSSSHSANTSFSDGSSDVWDNSTVYTPISTPRRGSPNDAKYQNSIFSVPTPTSSPDRCGAVNGFSAMNTFTQNIMTTYHQPHPSFSEVSSSNLTPNHAQPDFNTYGPYLNNSMVSSFVSNHGLPLSTPGLIHDDMFSPVSEMSSSSQIVDNCVVPSQTTFDAFGLQSPMNPVKSLQFNINYDCQPADYDTSLLLNNPSPGGLGYAVPELQPHRSEHSTPSRSPSHIQYFVQSQECESPVDFGYKVEAERAKTKKSLMARKRAGEQYDHLPGNIEVNLKPAFACIWRGCKAKFARLEHRKRHYFIHIPEKVSCPFCTKLFPKNRHDNIVTHVWIHAEPTKTSRTDFHPEAAAWIAQQVSERKGSKSSVKREGKKTPRVAKIRS